MKVLIALLIVLAIEMVLPIIDRKIKGDRSVVIKTISAILVGTFIIGFIYLYGQSILTTLGVNTKSFTNIKAFIARQLFKMLVLALLFLIIVFTMKAIVRIKETGNSHEKRIIHNEECKDSVFFDENEIPNIATSFSRTNFKGSINY